MAYTPALLVAILLTFYVTESSGVEPEDYSVLFFSLLVIVTPIVESLLLWILLKSLLKILNINELFVSILSALLMAFLHSIISIEWGAVQAWPFFIQSLVLTLNKLNFKAFTFVTAVHAFNNFIAFLILGS